MLHEIHLRAVVRKPLGPGTAAIAIGIVIWQGLVFVLRSIADPLHAGMNKTTGGWPTGSGVNDRWMHQYIENDIIVCLRVL